MDCKSRDPVRDRKPYWKGRRLYLYLGRYHGKFNSISDDQRPSKGSICSYNPHRVLPTCRLQDFEERNCHGYHTLQAQRYDASLNPNTRSLTQSVRGQESNLSSNSSSGFVETNARLTKFCHTLFLCFLTITPFAFRAALKLEPSFNSLRPICTARSR